MTKCKRCNVMILEDTKVCPLCRCVTEEIRETEGINKYPEVCIRQRKMQMASNLLLVVVLSAAMVLITIDLASLSDKWWCLIPVSALVYLYLAFRTIFVSRKGYRWKVFMSMSAAFILLCIIDIGTGFYGWSFNYVLPSIILTADFIILMLMVTNLKNWQSYMIIQIVVIAACVIPAALWAIGIISRPLLVLISTGISVLMFIGAFIIGGHTAKREMKIRFHIR